MAPVTSEAMPFGLLLRRPAPVEHAVVAVCALALAVTYRWTWAVWQVRARVDVPQVPNLSLVSGLAEFPMAWGLVVVCALMVVFPRIGTALNCVVLTVAVLGDQVRLQPEIVSLALLALAAAWSWRRIACAHLAVLWFWAGCNKALSYGWVSEAGPYIATPLRLTAHLWLVLWGVPLAEMAVGLSALWPRLRAISGIGGGVLHVGMVITLGPWLGAYNSAVWPWNAALVVCAPLLFLGPGYVGPFLPDRSKNHPPPRRGPDRVATAGVAFMAIAPVGFYLGAGDAYLSHNLYTSNTAQARRCSDQACVPFGYEAFVMLNVPLPPETRVYDAWFQKVCLPGERLEIIKPATRVTSEHVGTRPCAERPT